MKPLILFQIIPVFFYIDSTGSSEATCNSSLDMVSFVILVIAIVIMGIGGFIIGLVLGKAYELDRKAIWLFILLGFLVVSFLLGYGIVCVVGGFLVSVSYLVGALVGYIRSARE